MRIGFLFYDFSDSRALDVIRGLLEEGGKHHLILLPSGPLNSPSELEENEREILLDLIKESELDALVTLQFWESEEWFHRILSDHLSFPVIPLLRDYAGYPFIHVPYDEGMYHAVSHLIEAHNCRKLIFCSGSATESALLKKRFQGFRKALTDHNIEYEPYMLNKQKGVFVSGGIVSGVFHQGNKVVHELFIEKKLKPGRDINGLVVFNDRMAIEILESLNSLGIKVPEDIKIISHDNITESEYTRPPLTTIAMDWFQMGCLSIYLLENPGTSRKVHLDSTLIIRRSCGCENQNLYSPVNIKRDNRMFPDKGLQKTADSGRQLQELRQIQLQERRIIVIVQNMANVLAGCNTLEQIFPILKSGLEALGIKNGSLFLKDSHRSSELYKWVFHFKTNDKFLNAEKREMRQKEILSFTEKQFGCHFVIEPLKHGERSFGFLCVSLDNPIYSVYDDLRRILSNALYSQSLLRELKETQDYLIQSEKFSALGQLVAGVAHEVNTPLGVGITAASHLQSILGKIKPVNGKISCTHDDFMHYLEDLNTSSELVLQNLNRSAELVKKFKSITADTDSVEARTFELGGHFSSIINSLSPILDRAKVMVDLQCPEKINLFGFSGLYTQVISNLVMNSIQHGFSDSSKGNIHISVHKSEPGMLVIDYRDNGSGMSAEILDKVFDPFFTTQRISGRTGLGMFITYNIITQKLKGEIRADSLQGEGSSFEISIPIIK